MSNSSPSPISLQNLLVCVCARNAGILGGAGISSLGGRLALPSWPSLDCMTPLLASGSRFLASKGEEGRVDGERDRFADRERCMLFSQRDFSLISGGSSLVRSTYRWSAWRDRGVGRRRPNARMQSRLAGLATRLRTGRTV